MNKGTRTISRFKTLSVLAFTFLLIYLVIRKVGLDELLNLLRLADPVWLFLSFSIAPLSVLVSVVKWKILLDSQQVNVSLSRLYMYYLIGHFFNNFLPSTVGGDIVRSFELGNYTKNNVTALTSVFVERFTGFIALMFISLISIFYHVEYMKDPRLLFVMAIAVSGLFLILLIILNNRLVSLLNRSIQAPYFRKYLDKLMLVRSSLFDYKEKKTVLIKALVWSFIFMLVAIGNVCVSARVFYKPIPYLEVAGIVPIILIVAMMPFTMNGFGLQEWAYVFLFSWIGLPASVGLLTILLIRSKGILLATIGGLLYLITKVHNRRDVLDHQLGYFKLKDRMQAKIKSKD